MYEGWAKSTYYLNKEIVIKSIYYRIEIYICGFYRCVNSGDSLKAEWSPKGFMLSFWGVRRSLHIDKIHNNNN